MKRLLTTLAIIILLASCKTREKLYVQAMVKTEYGYKKIGDPRPHIVLLGDTIQVIYQKKF